MFCSFSLFAQRKRNQKKGHFSSGIFSSYLKNSHKNRILKAKFSPRLQKFLTLLKYYTYEKDL